MPRALRVRAFTLIEAMIVVVVVGILALLAVVAYRKWIRTAYMAEAQDMVAHIRGAEEAFHAENGTYLDVSGGLDLGYLYPADPPGAFKTAWGGPCPTHCRYSWSQLNVQAQAPTAFSYAVQADNSVPPKAPDQNSIILSPSTPVPDLRSMGSGPWYIVEAVGDIDGDGKNFTRIYGFSASSTLLIDNEGN
jgi:prepilin-type N-terminal cleavage/methylation domain-containing protein